MVTVKRSVVPGVGGKERGEWVDHRGFLGQETTLYDIVINDGYVSLCIQTYIECPPRANLYANYGLCLIMTCQYSHYSNVSM